MKNEALSQSEQKKTVGRYAVDDLVNSGIIHSGMKLGLGTGSTAMHAVKRIAEHISQGTLTGIRAVPTSFQTTIACEELGIPVFSLNAREIGGKLDLTIDGADEVSPVKHLIKGGGAALLLEKIVAYNSKIYVIIADESKAVSSLGIAFPLPIEIIAEARVSVCAALISLGAAVTIRHGSGKDGPVITDNGNLIVDCLWAPSAEGTSPIDPVILEKQVNTIVGVVENGFFTENTPIVYIAHADGSVEKR